MTSQASGAEAGQSPGRLSRGGISRRMVVGTAVLVAVVATLLGAATVSTLRPMLVAQLDDQLNAAVSRQGRGVDMGETGLRAPGIDMPGMPIGAIVVQVEPRLGQPCCASIVVEDLPGYAEIRVADFDVLRSLPVDASKHTIELPNHGTYRAQAFVRNGAQTIVALPMKSVTDAVRQMVRASVALSVAAVAVSVLATWAVARRLTRPLVQLADAAGEVSRLELGHGEVALPFRVEVSDEHPGSEIAQLGNAFNHMLTNVEGALAMRQWSESKMRQFVADASHELRNPLAAIRGYSELATRRSEDLPEDAAFALTRINAESIRMSKLVNDLLLLARLDSADRLHLQRVDMVELVLNSVSDSRAAHPGHEWVLSLPDEPAPVSADPDRMQQVLINLLTNAARHTPDGTRVETSVELAEAEVVLRVVDDGPGIPPEAQRQVFERFARADGARAHNPSETTGLGLAIVQALVAAHGGDVQLSSQPGRTEFSVRLPRVD